MDVNLGELPQPDNDRFTEALEKTLRQLDHLRLSGDTIVVDKRSRLGRGGFADVWAGTLSGQSDGVPIKVAVKKLRPKESLDDVLRTSVALVRELRAWATLQHPCILPLLGFHLDPDSLSAWIITPLATKGNARQYFKQTNPNSARRFDVILDVTKALVYLHGREEPVCHGDLKPDNILMNDDGKALLSDFGSSAIVEETPSGLTTTTSLQARTVRYMAPELFKDGQPRRTFASDVWSWGCVAAELMTGEVPYRKVKVDLAVLGEIVGAQNPPDFLYRVRDFPVPLLRWACDPTPESRPEIRQCLDILQPPSETGHTKFRIPKTGAPSRVFTGSIVDHPTQPQENDKKPSARRSQSIDKFSIKAGYTISGVDAKEIAAFRMDKTVELLNVVTGDQRKLDVSIDAPGRAYSFTPNLSRLTRSHTVQSTTTSNVNDPEQSTTEDATGSLTVVCVWDLEDGSLCLESRVPATFGTPEAVHPFNDNEWMLQLQDSVLLQKATDGVITTTHSHVGPIIRTAVSPEKGLAAIAWRSSSNQRIMLQIRKDSGRTTVGNVALPVKIGYISYFAISNRGIVVILDGEFNLWHWDFSSSLSNPPSDGVIRNAAQMIAYKLPIPELVLYMVLLPHDGSWVLVRSAEERLIIDLQTMAYTTLWSVEGEPLRNPRIAHVMTGANGLDVTGLLWDGSSDCMLKYEVFDDEGDLYRNGETSGLPLGPKNRFTNFCDLY